VLEDRADADNFLQVIGRQRSKRRDRRRAAVIGVGAGATGAGGATDAIGVGGGEGGAGGAADGAAGGVTAMLGATTGAGAAGASSIACDKTRGFDRFNAASFCLKRDDFAGKIAARRAQLNAGTRDLGLCSRGFRFSDANALRYAGDFGAQVTRLGLARGRPNSLPSPLDRRRRRAPAQRAYQGAAIKPMTNAAINGIRISTIR